MLVLHDICVLPTHVTLYDNILHTIPKTLLHVCIFLVWVEKPYDFRALTLKLLYKESTYIQGTFVSFTPLYKHQAFSSLKYVKIPNSQTIEFLEILLSLT